MLSSDLSHRAIAGLALYAVFAAALALGLRYVGFLEDFELSVYDRFLELGITPSATDPDIVVVEYRKDDSRRYGDILPDAQLADLLGKVLDDEPTAIGLDLIRDHPVPNNGAAFDQPLDALLDDHPSIIGIVWNPGTAGGFGPPPVLEGRIDRFGAADIIVDPDHTVRRGLLFTSVNGQALPSLALQLALRHAAAKGLDGSYENDRLRLGEATLVPFDDTASGFYRSRNGNGGYQFLLTYPACNGGLQTVSVTDVLDGSARGRFKEKLVLIGNTIPEAKDRLSVPLLCSGSESQSMFGVHLHAQMVRQLIDLAEGKKGPLEIVGQKFNNIVPAWTIDSIWVSLWVFPGIIASALLTAPFVFMAACLTIVGSLLATTAFAFIWFGLWLPVVPPFVSFALSTFLSVTYLLMLTREKGVDLQIMLRGMLPPKVADRLLRHAKAPLAFAPEHKTATILFSDVVGFAAIAERLPEERLAQWLNDYLAAMVKIIDRQHGGVEKFVGDGIAAGFGVADTVNCPNDIERHAKAAVDAALEMANHLRELNVRWQQEGLPEIGVRIGIHTGPLMVGVIGTDVRWQYTFIGDTANTAARLESYGKDDPDLYCAPGHCRIFVSGSTWKRVGAFYSGAFIGNVELRSKAKLVSVYRVESCI